MGAGVVELRNASIKRRFAAGLVDGFSFLAVFVAVVAAIVTRVGAREHWQRRTSASSEVGQPGQKPGWIARLESPTGKVAIGTCGLAVAVLGRNWRSPGARLLGLRRVDARTGGAISVRSALLRFAVTKAWTVPVRRLCRPLEQRAMEPVARLQSAVKAINQTYPDDPGARARALREFREGDTLNPLGGCVSALPQFVLQTLVTIPTPCHESIADRAAGIITVEATRLNLVGTSTPNGE